MTLSLRRFALAASCMLVATQLLAAEPKRPECIAPASPGGGFDLTCKLVQSALVNEKLLSKPMRVTYMPVASARWPITQWLPSALPMAARWLRGPADRC